MDFLDKFLNKVSKGDKADVINDTIKGNVLGFYRTGQNPQLGDLIIEMSRQISKGGHSVCIIDTNPSSSFYSSKFSDKMQMNNKLGFKTIRNFSITNRLQNSKCGLSECLIDIDDRVKILSFGTSPLDYLFGLDYSSVEAILLEVKANFDFVLIDVYNNPLFETVTASLKICNTLLSIWGPTQDSFMDHYRLTSLFANCGFGERMTDVVVMGLPYGTTLAQSYNSALAQGGHKSRVVLEIPTVPYTSANINSAYLLDASKGKEANLFSACVDHILEKYVTVLGGES